jgi:hypothetical protein
LTRHILTPERRRIKLADYLAELPVVGTYSLNLPANQQQIARTANISTVLSYRR